MTSAETGFVSRDQARQVDQRAIDEYGMLGIVLMENAGRGCVDTLCGLGIRGPVAICCGRGNNAGDGFVIARHLDLRGHPVRVLIWGDPDELRGDAAHNFRILQHSDVPLVLCGDRGGGGWLAEHLDGADWVVDALLGTGARGEPRPPLDSVIDALNQCPAKKLAVDLPSGLECDTGVAARPTFRADETCTFVAPKLGFRAECARPYVGRVHVLDIGVPRKLVAQIAGATEPAP
jgi:NAD(P)H-hydrate epimerase